MIIVTLYYANVINICYLNVIVTLCSYITSNYINVVLLWNIIMLCYTTVIVTLVYLCYAKIITLHSANYILLT